MHVTTSSPLPAFHPACDVEIAVLDEDGVIVAVNESWAAFCLYNGGDPAACGAGVNYLAICDQNHDDPATAAVATTIRAAISGELIAATSIAIACDSPSEHRWFELIVAPRRRAGRPCGATVMLAHVAGPQPSPPGAGGNHSRGVGHDVEDDAIDHIYTAGLSLRRLAGALSTPDARALLDRALDELDAAIRTLGRAAFDGDGRAR